MHGLLQLSAPATAASCDQTSHAEQVVHGAYPDMENVEPSSHVALHTVSVVVLHAVSTPSAFPHVLLAEQIVHGVKPDTDHVEPTTHGAA